MSHMIMCPFGPHRMGSVRVHPTRDGVPASDDGIIERHTIPSGPYQGIACPASLMHWPLDNASRSALTQQAVDLGRQEMRYAGRDMERHGGVWPEHREPPAPPESGSLRQPGRMGREPHPESPDWALGGREDEDVPRAEDVVKGPVPRTTQGVSMDMRGTGMSISVNVGLARRAMTLTDEAAQKMMEAQASVNAAIAGVQELLGDGSSPSLMDWLAHLRAMHKHLADGLGQGDMANGDGQGVIDRLMS